MADFSDLDEARECARNDPHRALELENRYIAANPNDPHGYFSRHISFCRFGNYEAALADCNRAIELNPSFWRYRGRGEVYRRLGNHQQALADFDRAKAMDIENWLTSFGPHMRADTLARLGRRDEALADANLIDDDHWMPEHDGLPGGNKQEFIAEIERRAAAAKR
jgi:tetratricopeptide (TPR) repeat protein